MTAVIIETSMSLDGYITGHNDSDVNPLGDGGPRPHNWMFADSGHVPGEGLTGVDKRILDELRTDSWSHDFGAAAIRHHPWLEWFSSFRRHSGAPERVGLGSRKLV
jgi:hypothetical protein